MPAKRRAQGRWICTSVVRDPVRVEGGVPVAGLAARFSEVGSGLQIFPEMEREAVGRQVKPAGAGIKKMIHPGFLWVAEAG